MAKKKQMHAKKAAPKKQEGSSLGWIIAAIVVIAVIAFLVMRPSGKTTEPTTTPDETATVPGLFTEAAAPTNWGKKCINAIGVVPGTQTVDANNVLSVTFKNNGRTGIEGTYFEFTDAEGEKRYKKNSDAVAAGATIQYSIDLNQVGAELESEVKTFVLYSVEDGLVCENQRRIVISA